MTGGTTNVAVVAAAQAILEAHHPEPESEGVRDTPLRVARMWTEVTRGYADDPAAILSRTFEREGYDEVVALAGIHFFSMCEHHLLPIEGTAGVAYLPGSRVVGLSKLARLVDCYARRFQIQERMTRQIADALQLHLKPLGVAVLIEARHLCMVARGVTKEQAVMRTSALLGAFRDRPEARAEVLGLLRVAPTI